jgi:hypothetical protein
MINTTTSRPMPTQTIQKASGMHEGESPTPNWLNRLPGTTVVLNQCGCIGILTVLACIARVLGFSNIK